MNSDCLLNKVLALRELKNFLETSIEKMICHKWEDQVAQSGDVVSIRKPNRFKGTNLNKKSL